MKLTDAAIGRFRALWEKTYPDRPLTDAQADDYASRIITLVSAVVEAPLLPRGRGPPK